MTYKFIATTLTGLEEVLFQELQELGANCCQLLKRSVSFEGDLSMLYRANYFCRTALRILIEKKTFSFRNNRQFYEAIFDFAAENHLSYQGTLAVSVTMHNTIFKTPLFAAMLAKDAICDRFRDKFGKRPSVDKDYPDVQFHVYIYNDQATLYLDSSGESLHKRGYKISPHPAAINEVLAAGMIQLSGWKQDCDFIDFLCGGATLLIEAAMLALRIPAGFYRSEYGFHHWLDFDENLWNRIIDEADIKEDVTINFYGYDISPRYLSMAQDNIEQARLQDFIKISESDFQQTTPVRTPAWIMLNPPYNERLKLEDTAAFYKEIGNTFKNKYADCTAFLITADLDALKSVGLHPSRKITLYNAEYECKFMKYELYQGKKYKE